MRIVAESSHDETADIEAMTAHIRIVIDRLVQRDVERGAATYVRERDLGMLLRNWQLMSHGAIVRRLEEKARAEAMRLIAGHWTGDHNRLISLKAALMAESEREQSQ